MTLACACKAKCTLIPSRVLSAQELVTIDDLPWGAKPIAAHAQVLGLTLASKARCVLPLTPEQLADPALKSKCSGLQIRQVVKAAEDKIQLKSAQRSAMLKRTITPIPQRAAAHSGWIQSLSHYSSSVFGKTQKHRNKLQVGHASLVLGSHWMKADGLQEKLAYLKISSASPTKRAEETAAISLAIRRFGGTRLVCNLPPLPHEFGSRVTSILVGWRKN